MTRTVDTHVSSRGTRLLPVLAGVTAFTALLGWLQKRPCADTGFDFLRTTERGCYTDVYPLFFARGFADGKLPYFDTFEGESLQYVEYPVVSGFFMQLMAVLSRPFEQSGMAYFHLTALVLGLFAILGVLATAYTAGRHSLRAGLMVALAPSLVLTAYINWDLLAVGLTALSLLAWSRRYPAMAGALLGLAAAAKFYPLLFLGPLFLLCVRAAAWRDLGRLVAGTAGAWLVVNLPVMVFAWDGWKEFYTFSQERGIDWGSIFFVLRDRGLDSAEEHINLFGTGTFLLLCVGIAVLTWAAPRRPRLPQLMLLVLIAFMLPNKVWSPQYVLWLLPLVVLARPKLPAFVIWQVGEIIYFFGVWWYLLSASALNVEGAGLGETLRAVAGFEAPAQGISADVYHLAILARFLTVVMLAVLVVWEILRPERDVVRTTGGDAETDVDDPAGGVLDGADDRWTFQTMVPALSGVLRGGRSAAGPKV